MAAKSKVYAKTMAADAIADLTVAISTFERPDGLRRCLDALLGGKVLPAEVVIIDQSRDDSTRALIEDRQVGSVPIVYVHQQRRGLSASRNAAINHAKHPVLAFTDDDCMPDGAWVAAIESTFASASPPDAATGRVLPLGPDEPGTYSVSPRDSSVRADFSGRLIPWFIGTGGNFAVKREWLSRVGNYDERLGVGSPGKAAEDADFFYRLLRAGARVRYEPDALVYHERQSKNRRMTSRYSYGYGIGAFCGIWLCRRDPYALHILSYWVLNQCLGLARAIRRWHWMQAHESSLSLRGTLHGLLYGLRVREVT
jgi:glycosyltransferase involved in cell wall biosynthesis